MSTGPHILPGETYLCDIKRQCNNSSLESCILKKRYNNKK